MLPAILALLIYSNTISK
uniref:Uncharacterized protein n=1 Tax=Anguilla anguilla TaxID=7936 RepID=A0A0E9UEG4_ANGAN